MRIALAWELGANYGHLMRGRVLAESLRAQGHEVSFLVRDVRTADQLLTPAGFAFDACPIAPTTRQRLDGTPLNYSDLLARQGYADVAVVGPLVRSWLALLQTVDPQMLIVDHAPLALLSSRILSIPAVLIGSPFSIPRADDPMPALNPHRAVAREDLVRADQRLLRAINDVLAALGCNALESVAGLFAERTPHLASFAELDCYGPRPGALYFGPITSRDSLPAVHWTPDSGRKRVVAYLRPSVAGLEPLLQALRHAPIQLICVVPGARDSMLDRWRREGIEVRGAPIDLSALLPDADLAINYGALNSTAQALLEGVPLMLVPHELEQRLNAIRAAELGAAVIVDEQRTQARFADALDRLLHDPAYGSAARAFAAAHAGYEQQTLVDQLAERIVRGADALD